MLTEQARRPRHPGAAGDRVLSLRVLQLPAEHVSLHEADESAEGAQPLASEEATWREGEKTHGDAPCGCASREVTERGNTSQGVRVTAHREGLITRCSRAAGRRGGRGYEEGAVG